MSRSRWSQRGIRRCGLPSRVRIWKRTSCERWRWRMREAVGVEVLKLRRSPLPALTAGAFVVAAAVGGVFMFILQDPARARQLGLLGAKAELAGVVADWPGYF